MEANREASLDRRWAARIDLASSSAAAVLRTRTDVRAAIVGDSLWLRGERLDVGLDQLLDFIAPHDRFTLDVGDVLRRIGDRLPCAALPGVGWEDVATVFPVDWPARSKTAPAPPAAALRIVRSDQEQAANAILMTLEALNRWADEVSAIRFVPLRFAATESHALVLGTPVPSASGLPLYEQAGVLLPCGWNLAPVIDRGSLRQLLRLADDDLAMFFQTGWQRISAQLLVQATRSAIRQTCQRGRDDI